MPSYLTSRRSQLSQTGHQRYRAYKRYDDVRTYELPLERLIPAARSVSSLAVVSLGPTVSASSLTTESGYVEQPATVTCTLTGLLALGQTVLARTSLVAPSAASTNIWLNRDAFTINSAAPVSVVYEPLNAGAASSVLAGALDTVLNRTNIIATVTNDNASTSGVAGTSNVLSITLTGAGDVEATLTLDNSDTLELLLSFIATDQPRRNDYSS